jgi:hypothetical protein
VVHNIHLLESSEEKSIMHPTVLVLGQDQHLGTCTSDAINQTFDVVLLSSQYCA